MPIPTSWLPTEWVDERLRVLGKSIATELKGDIDTLEQNLETKIVTEGEQMIDSLGDVALKIVGDVVAGIPDALVNNAEAIATALFAHLPVVGGLPHLFGGNFSTTNPPPATTSTGSAPPKMPPPPKPPAPPNPPAPPEPLRPSDNR